MVPQAMPYRGPADYARVQMIRGVVGASAGIVLLVGISIAVVLNKGGHTVRGLNISAPATLGLFDIGPAYPIRIDRIGVAGGPIDAARVDASCRGHFPRIAHALIRVRQPSVLSLTTLSNGVDLTMAVHAPDGTFRCDDDSGEGMNPRIQGPFLPGDYHVWVGMFGEGQTAAFTLSLQVEATGTAVTEHGIVPDVAPTLGIVDFATEPGGIRRPSVANGTVAGSDINASCRGVFPPAPATSFTLTQPRFVSITTESNADLTLLIRGPNGQITCDDDSGNGTNPRLDGIDPPGSYQVWIGPFSQSHAAAPYTLSIVSDPVSQTIDHNGLSYASRPVFATVDVATVSTPQTYQGVTFGRIEGTRIDMACGARFLAVPHVALQSASPRRVHITATAAQGINVLMRTPDGTERCPASSSNNVMADVDLPAGTSQLWVGTDERDQHVPFELTVSPEPQSSASPRRTNRSPGR